MRAVVDTNVVVAALLSPTGTPARVLEWAINGDFRLCLSAAILAEYREVLLRPAFAFDPGRVEWILQWLEREADLVTPSLTACDLPDADDAIFLQTAVAAQADYLVTGNLKHFPAAKCHGFPVVSPRQFVQVLTDQHEAR